MMTETTIAPDVYAAFVNRRNLLVFTDAPKMVEYATETMRDGAFYRDEDWRSLFPSETIKMLPEMGFRVRRRGNCDVVMCNAGDCPMLVMEQPSLGIGNITSLLATNFDLLPGQFYRPRNGMDGIFVELHPHRDKIFSKNEYVVSHLDRI